MDFFGISKSESTSSSMNITFSKEELETFEKEIKNTPFYRSWCSNKKDIKKFLFQLCKNHTVITVKSISTDVKKKTTKDVKKKTTKDVKKITRKIENTSIHSYKICKVTQGYKFPSSIYKKSSSKEAAEIALKAITKKNNLGKNKNFTFTLISKEKEYKFTVKNGSI